MEHDTFTGNSRRFAPPSQMGSAGGPSNRSRVPKNKLPGGPGPVARPAQRPSEVLYWTQMYLMGFLAAWALEGLLLACLAQWRLTEVGIIMVLLFCFGAIFTTCMYWSRPLSKQISVAAIGVAMIAALIGGLFGGSYLQMFWFYGSGNTFANVKAAAPPDYWKGEGHVPNTFLFTNITYVKTDDAGVAYRGGDLPYCVSPILSKEPKPMDHVIYYAAAVDCCSGTEAANAKTHCYHWGDHDIVGERLPESDQAFFEQAVVKAVTWHDNFPTSPNPVFLSVMKKADHDARQSERKKNGWIVIVCTPILWPLLAIIIYVLRWLTIATCGVHKKNLAFGADQGRGQYAPVGQRV